MNSLLAKAVTIAIAAGAIAALPYAVLFSVGLDISLILAVAWRYLAFGIVSSLIIGLPIALLVFKLVRSDENFGRAELFLTANGVAIVIAAILAALSGWFGAFLFGIPVIVAANTYAIAGWRYVLRDLREDQFA